MSLTIKHLNGDTTFLLIFTPLEARPSSPPEGEDCLPPGTFTVLIDPWLTGTASMLHRKFLLSRHTTPAWIQHLSQIPEPNVVLVTQDKPDHCHEATLRQLDPYSPITMVLAEPAAAKRIRGMKHFDPLMVHDLRNYSSKKEDSVIKFCIPPIVSGGTAGEATISFIPGKMDLAGVHNAVGVTYRPPSTTAAPSRPSTSRDPIPLHYPYPSPLPPAGPLTPPDSPPDLLFSQTSSTASSSDRPTLLSTPSHTRTMSSTSSISSIRYPPQTERSLSVIYSPHGLPYQLIRPYAASHLVRQAALPLTALLHSFNRVNNPWWMGGNVAAGLPGGAEIAKNLMARCWISAHDEEKDNTGISVANVKTKKYSLTEAAQGVMGTGTRVMNLGVGEDVTLNA